MSAIIEPFDVLVVDPPWSYGAKGKRGAAERHYKTVGRGNLEIHRHHGAGVENIAPIVPMAEWSHRESHLYLWVTSPKLPFGFALLGLWGFEYKTTLVWVKTARSGRVIRNGPGWWFRNAAEYVLVGVRKGRSIPSHLREPTVFMASRGAHSEKPQAFYDIIDRVEPGKRKIDVFARTRRPGWWSWGDELGPQALPPLESIE